MGVINRIIPIHLIKNLIAYYRLYGDALDYSGNNFHADVVDNINWVNGIVGLSAEFNNTDDRKIEIPAYTELSFTDGNGNDKSFSLSLWIRWRGTNSFFINKRDSNDGNIEYQMSIYNSNLRFWLFGNNSNSDAIGIGLDYTNYQDDWYHLTITYDGSKTENGFKLYINGQLANYSLFSIGTYTGTAISSSKLSFGNPRWTTNYNLLGEMQMVAIFYKELSSNEVLKYYNIQTHKFLK